ncbi:MAG: hypothetical protein IPP19_08570 [Verrucomicrobia bacterium]|nr:hypothetical protein [Verrucomicrobiota bacterium]
MSESIPTSTPKPTPTASWYERSAWIVVSAVFLLLAWRQHQFVNQHAVNILFWDQWDFYAPLFREGSLWEIFKQQHGPHRQGLGFLLTDLLTHLSGWNSRWDAFGVSFVLIFAGLLGLLLARRCGARGISLVTIPLLFLNIRQYEMFVNASNISHGAMPMLLFMALLLCLFIERDALRLLAISLLTFLAIFTGFGIFVGLVIPMVLVVQMIQHWRQNEKQRALSVLLALVAIGAAWALFSVGYRFDPAVSDYRFPYEKPWEYFYFIAAMLNNFHGMQTQSLPVLIWGLTCTAFLGGLALFHGWRILRHGVLNERRSTVIFCLAAFSLIYGLNTAIGRVFSGWQEAGAASRYVTLMIPAGLAAYLHFATLNKAILARTLTIAYVCFLAYNTVELHTRDWRSINHYSEGRRAWKAAYLETRSEEQASERTHFQVYPAPVLGDRLRYLEAHRLNLFNSDAHP